MSILNSVILGIIQGLTEFLPVSSSGHLVIAQHLLSDFYQPGVLFDVTLHAGTLFSVLYYFRKKIMKIDTNYIGLIVVGTIPAVIFGFLFKDFFESLFTNVKLVGIALVVTGLMNYLTDKFKTTNKEIVLKDSVIIGFFQALAIIPGVSRSGSTIFLGTKRGLTGKKAAEFSFLLSVPAVFGANILELVSYHNNFNVNVISYVLGFISAFISGLLAIKLVFNFLEEKNFKVFFYYALGLGIFTLIFLW